MGTKKQPVPKVDSNDPHWNTMDTKGTQKTVSYPHLTLPKNRLYSYIYSTVSTS